MGRVVRELKHAWNAFANPAEPGFSAGPSMAAAGGRSTRSPARYFNDRSIITSIYTRIAVDVSSVQFFHARLDENDVATEVIRDNLHDCITVSSNVDQTAPALFLDYALTLMERGTAAVVPTDLSLDPATSTSWDIKAMRVGTVAAWFPRRVTVDVYDDREVDDQGNPVNGGVTKQITLPKDMVALVENPFYGVMNEPNGAMQRLSRKLALLDEIDEAAGSGKLDMLIQLPYTVRAASRKKQAQDRRAELVEQLKNDELGIGYIDISEKVIQLNRPIDNKLLEQIEYLTKQVFDMLGLTPEIMNGTASRDTINNYMDRTVEPIANALAVEMKRKFLTKTARTQGHSIEIYRDPLKLIPISELAEVADKLIRNSILTINEFRPKIGYRPSKDPMADKLHNPNMPIDKQIPVEGDSDQGLSAPHTTTGAAPGVQTPRNQGPEVGSSPQSQPAPLRVGGPGPLALQARK